MRGAAVAVSYGRVFGHGDFLMVLLKVDPVGIAVRKFECDTPGPIHMNGVASRLAVQSVIVKPWQVHLFRRFSGIQSVEPQQDPPV